MGDKNWKTNAAAFLRNNLRMISILHRQPLKCSIKNPDKIVHTFFRIAPHLVLQGKRPSYMYCRSTITSASART